MLLVGRRARVPPIGAHWVLEQAIAPESECTQGVIGARTDSVRFAKTLLCPH
ncbi:MAG: hypothetical protein JW934_12575 [Anaerolineae bacterium]|nr:hypothetical protein [Anaerolineae bacterium]